MSLLRHESAIFRLTGYYPILPLVLRERAMLFRYGSLEAAYAAERGAPPAAVFTPGVASRSAALALETAKTVGDSVSRQLSRWSEPASKNVQNRSEAGCAPPWSVYCQSIFRAVQFALARGQYVAVGSQPLSSKNDAEAHVQQQLALVEMLQRRFAREPRVVHVDLRHGIDLKDPSLSFDEMHLTAEGNQLAAGRMAQALRPMVASVRASRQ